MNNDTDRLVRSMRLMVASADYFAEFSKQVPFKKFRDACKSFIAQVNWEAENGEMTRYSSAYIQQERVDFRFIYTSLRGDKQ